jgi:hypothetical protein
MERRKDTAIAQNPKLINQHSGVPCISFIDQEDEGRYNVPGHMHKMLKVAR